MNRTVKRAAPTAKAAYLINGETCHALFGIHVNNESKSQDISAPALRALQEAFKGIEFVIIDEYSMLSQTMLSKIDIRLRQITQKKSQYFGGLSVILTGDPGQLPAVCAPSLYSTHSNDNLNINGFNAYRQFTVVVKLEQVMRQEVDLENPDQKHFIEMIPRFRNGDSTLKDWELLIKRSPTPELLKQFQDAPRIFPENIPCDKFNIERISSLKQPITSLHAVNEPRIARKYDAENFNGLNNLLYLCIDAKVVITSNIWKRVGILNGASGTIKAILYPDDKQATTLPHTIVVHLPA